MGYYDSAGRWINNTPQPFQTSGVMPQTAWGGTSMFSNQATMVPISGRAAAEDYPVAPGAKVFLVDANELVTYVKERDPQGQIMSFQIYKWQLQEPPKQDTAIQSQTIDYERIREMIREEVANANKSRTHKEAK